MKTFDQQLEQAFRAGVRSIDAAHDPRACLMCDQRFARFRANLADVPLPHVDPEVDAERGR